MILYPLRLSSSPSSGSCGFMAWLLLAHTLLRDSETRPPVSVSLFPVINAISGALRGTGWLSHYRDIMGESGQERRRLREQFSLYQISFCVSPHVADPDSEGRGLLISGEATVPSLQLASSLVLAPFAICWCCESTLLRTRKGPLENRMNLPGMGPAKYCTAPSIIATVLRDRLSTPELPLPVRCHADLRSSDARRGANVPAQPMAHPSSMPTPTPTPARRGGGGGGGREATGSSHFFLIPMMCPLSR